MVGVKPAPLSWQPRAGQILPVVKECESVGNITTHSIPPMVHIFNVFDIFDMFRFSPVHLF